MPPIFGARGRSAPARRAALIAGLAGLAGLAGSPAPASAGVVAFQSDRCESVADAEARRDFHPFPGPVPTCRSAIWTVRDDGTSLRRLTDSGPRFASGDAQPAWTPDGTRIVFSRALSGAAQGGSRIFVTGARGGPVVQLTPTVAAGAQFHSDYAPVVSPDGGTIVFQSDRPFSGRPEGGRFDSDLYAMDLDGGNLRVLVPGPTNDTDPAFSPDGRRVLFTRYDVPFRNPRIISVDAATGRAPYQHTITGLPTAGATFSPDGRYIALAIVSHLFTMRADGSQLQSRVATPSFEPTWVGDGGSIIYAGPRTPSPTERAIMLFRTPLSGAATAGTPLTPPYGNDLGPAWRPDAPLEVLRPIVDALPPVASLLDAVEYALPTPIGGGLARAASAAARPVARSLRPRRARLTVKRMRNVTYVAADRSGLRRAELALERRLPSGGCRALGGDGRLGRTGACGRARWLRPPNVATWKRWMGRLGNGTYTVRVRAVDRGGRTTPRPTTVTVRDR